MTLRVNISVIPHSLEFDEYDICQIDIHNVRQIEDQGFGNQICEYKAEFKHWTNGEWETIDSTSLTHNRRDGSVRLAEMACRAFEDSL